MKLEIDRINAMDRSEFVRAFGGIFEHSPWVAERAWETRPFADLDAMHAAMTRVVESAPRERQIALLQAHPDLAGREAQSGTMTDHSVSEQASAGLNALTRDEMRRIEQLNAAYREKHGFPFIIAVRCHTKNGILQQFEQRLLNDSDIEREQCLQQVYTITKLRIQALAGH